MKHTQSPLRDSNGQWIGVGDTVSVPDPNETDIHNHAFTGYVNGFHGEYVVVEDGDGNYFDMEADRLTVINDEIH